jgi:phage gpG-like protein
MAPAAVTAQPVLTLDFKPSLRIVATRIDKLGLDIRSFKVPLKRCVKDVIIPSIRKNFDAGGRPSWAPYSEVTVAMHEDLKEAMSSGMLVKSGKLRATMGFQNIWTITKDEAYLADIPANVWYGKLHQSGGLNLPARPFVMLQPGDAEDIVNVFDKWLDERIDAAWPGV